MGHGDVSPCDECPLDEGFPPEKLLKSGHPLVVLVEETHRKSHCGQVMPASRFPRLRRAIVPLLAMTVLNTPVHPAQATPAALDATLDVRVGQTTVVGLPLQANMVSVSIPARQKVPHLKLGDDQGAWHEVSFSDDHAPDAVESVARENRLFSDPIWVGSVDSLRVQGDKGTDRAVRLHLINTLGAPGLSTPGSLMGRLWHSLTVPRRAEALVKDQPIISRADWGADESWVNGPPGPAQELKAIFVHHTDSSNTYKRSQVAAMVRGIYSYHTRTRGWSDIGYNFLIDRFGNIYEGRGGGITEPIIGAHARGANEGSTGISLIGNFTSQSPPKAMRLALARLVAWKADIHHIPVVGKVNLFGKKFNRINGHRDANSTACPGNRAYDLLPWLRKAAHNFGLPKMYLPRTSTDLLRRDGDGSNEVWRLQAWGSSDDLEWTLTILDSSGLPVHEQVYTGRRLETAGKSGLIWRGTGASGQELSNGRYSWSIGAVDSKGRRTRGAGGTVTLIRDHFPGTLLKDSLGTYLVSGTSLGAVVAEPLSPLAARTRFRARTPVDTGRNERGRYGTAPSDGLRVGALLSENGTLLLVTGSNEVAPFAQGVAAALGYKASAALAVTTEQLAGVNRRSTPVSDTTRHPPGTYVRNPRTDGSIEYFRIRAADRVSVRRAAILGRGVGVEVVPATPGDLALPNTGTLEDAPDGSLFRTAGGTYWLISSGHRLKVVNYAYFGAFGYRIESAILVNHADIKHFPAGEKIT